jgi:acetolactate decarboxylase
MSGLFRGTLPLKELLEQGNLGIGTLHGLDGELVIIEGKAYQVTVDGEVMELTGTEKTPYAAVAAFNGEAQLTVEELISQKAFKEKLKENFSSENTFQAVKVTGTFKNIRCRSVEKQTTPYPRLAEVAEDQAEFKRETVNGTLVGFYTPEIFGTIAVPEFHWHFLSEDLDFGGHVLEFDLEEGTASWQTIETLKQHFPLENETFMEEAIDYGNLADEIEAAE